MCTMKFLKMTPTLLLLICACSDDTAGQDPDGRVPDQSNDDIATQLDGSLPSDSVSAAACAPSKSLLSRVDPARMLKDFKFREGLVERSTQASQTKAAAYLLAELKKLSSVTVKEHQYVYQGKGYVNLEATIQGSDSASAQLFMGAHYDSTSSDPTLAPGADDNASGTAAILEVARAFAGCKPARTVRFLLFSNEEKGTIGSKAYVKDLKATLPNNKLLGYINVDMIAYGPANEDLDLATRVKYKALAENMAKTVEKWTTLKTNLIVSDHCG